MRINSAASAGPQPNTSMRMPSACHVEIGSPGVGSTSVRWHDVWTRRTMCGVEIMTVGTQYATHLDDFAQCCRDWPTLARILKIGGLNLRLTGHK
jgi:hypothetical protein